MADMKEKLVELIRNAKSAMFAEILNCDIAKNYFIAEFLIENGVTVQDCLKEKQATSDKTSEWISVKDRLPEDWCPVLVMVRETEMPLLGSYRENVWFHEMWNTTFINGAVTHWMPLPQPPKGD